MAGEDIVDVSVFTAAVHVPLAGEPVIASTLKIPLQALANRTDFLNDAATDHAATLDVLRGSGGSRVFPFVSADPSSSGQWDSTFGDGMWTQISVSVGINRGLTCQIELPTGSEVTAVEVWLTGIGHGAIPAVPPAWFLYQVGTTGGTLLASKSDTTTWPGYDTAHALPVTGLSIDIDNSAYVYTINCYGESGANSLAHGLQVFLARVYFTPIP